MFYEFAYCIIIVAFTRNSLVVRMGFYITTFFQGHCLTGLNIVLSIRVFRSVKVPLINSFQILIFFVSHMEFNQGKALSFRFIF